MDLFEYARQKNMDQEAPLASRLCDNAGGSGRTAAYYWKRQACCTVQSKQIS